MGTPWYIYQVSFPFPSLQRRRELGIDAWKATDVVLPPEELLARRHLSPQEELIHLAPALERGLHALSSQAKLAEQDADRPGFPSQMRLQLRAQRARHLYCDLQPERVTDSSIFTLSGPNPRSRYSILQSEESRKREAIKVLSNPLPDQAARDAFFEEMEKRVAAVTKRLEESGDANAESRARAMVEEEFRGQALVLRWNFEEMRNAETFPKYRNAQLRRRAKMEAILGLLPPETAEERERYPGLDQESDEKGVILTSVNTREIGGTRKHGSASPPSRRGSPLMKGGLSMQSAVSPTATTATSFPLPLLHPVSSVRELPHLIALYCLRKNLSFSEFAARVGRGALEPSELMSLVLGSCVVGTLEGESTPWAIHVDEGNALWVEEEEAVTEEELGVLQDFSSSTVQKKKQEKKQKQKQKQRKTTKKQEPGGVSGDFKGLAVPIPQEDGQGEEQEGGGLDAGTKVLIGEMNKVALKRAQLSASKGFTEDSDEDFAMLREFQDEEEEEEEDDRSEWEEEESNVDLAVLEERVLQEIVQSGETKTEMDSGASSVTADAPSKGEGGRKRSKKLGGRGKKKKAPVDVVASDVEQEGRQVMSLEEEMEELGEDGILPLDGPFGTQPMSREWDAAPNRRKLRRNIFLDEDDEEVEEEDDDDDLKERDEDL